MTKTENIVRTVCLSLVTLVFLSAGVMKLIGLPFEVNSFIGWGYPLWFMYVVGVCEVTGSIGLHFPKIARYASVGLVVIALGAIGTHVFHDEGLVTPIPATVTLIMLFYIISVSHKKPVVAV